MLPLFFGSFAKDADKCHRSPAAVVHRIYLFIYNIFGLYFGSSTMSSYQFRDSGLSRYEQVACRVSLTLTLSGNDKQTNHLAKDAAETGYCPFKKPDFTHRGVSCALFELKETCTCVHMLHICTPSATYARSCSDRIISAQEHFAPPKLIHSSSFVYPFYSPPLATSGRFND